MTGGFEPGIVAASLLPHEPERLPRQSRVGIWRDGKRQRFRLADAQDVFARSFQPREIHFDMAFELAPFDVEEGPGFSPKENKYDVLRPVFDDRKRFRQRRF